MEVVATDFLLMLSPAVDGAYRLFIEKAAQLCADINFDSAKIATLLNSPDAKFDFSLGWLASRCGYPKTSLAPNKVSD